MSKINLMGTPAESQPEPEEPRYVDVDADEPNEHRRPKWMTPQTPLQQRLLESVGRRYFHREEKELRHQLILIEKSTGSLTQSQAVAYPSEWIEHCLEWVRTKRLQGEWISLKGLVGLLTNPDRKADFLARWSQKRRAQ